MAVFAAMAKAGIVEERQNPSFITTLPTAGQTAPATRSTAVITTATSATTSPALLTTTSSLSIQTTSAPKPTISPTSPLPAVAVDVFQGPYFGGVPARSPDIALTSVFLVSFLLGAIINAIIYRSKFGLSRRTKRDEISGLAGLFCLARVLSCVLRDIWAVYITSTGAIFLALVSENAG